MQHLGFFVHQFEKRIQQQSFQPGVDAAKESWTVWLPIVWENMETLKEGILKKGVCLKMSHR